MLVFIPIGIAFAVKAGLGLVARAAEIKKVHDLTQGRANLPTVPGAEFLKKGDGTLVTMTMLFAPEDLDRLDACPNKCACVYDEAQQRATTLKPMLNAQGQTQTCGSCGHYKMVA